MDDVITHCPTSQLNKDLKDEQNKSLPSPVTPLLKPPLIDPNLFITPNFFEKTHKPLSPAIYPPEIPTIKSKQFDLMNFLDKKQSLSPVSNDILKICCNKLDSLNWLFMLNQLPFPKPLNPTKRKKKK